MKRYVIISLCLVLALMSGFQREVSAKGRTIAIEEGQIEPYVKVPSDREGEVTGQAYRSGRGSFSGVRSPGGSRTGTTAPGRNPSNAANNPRTTNPGYGTPTRGGWGGIFGGFAAGALIGSLFNPFGFMGFGPGAGSPLSFIGLLFWAVVIYLVYRLFTRHRRNQP
ncbi:hypothetical protein N0M98_24230 [Paenibacillus doosanensis]|uniref:hypothetical protein n=1 Tax=Paenibacillus doosanensis TaxID=1229154 RepID=UPI00217F962E|nr:hypothetical protein [Paenibacillus doosanensis]MCS7463237.1 hypothetical protein [Paenibacillus doosanensis]